MKKKLSLTYRFLKTIGLNYSEEEYGNVSILKVFCKFFGNIFRAFLLRHLMDSVILEPIAPRFMRAKILNWLGCKVGKHVFIGEKVVFDAGHIKNIIIDDYVHIASRCILLCHQRNLTNYCVGDNYADLSYSVKKIHLKKGCLIGMNTMIMPGVTIGEGAIVGSYSLVNKDIPPWTVALGIPAKVIKDLPNREEKQ